jgi:DNA modification methylase
VAKSHDRLAKTARPTPATEQRQATEPSLTGLHQWGGHTKANVPWEVHRGDVQTALATLQPSQFHCVITSPPYFWQRDYNVDGQIGKEPNIDGYVKAIADAMDRVKVVLRNDGLLFLNLGDTYYSGRGEPKGADKKSKARRFGLRAVDASGMGVPKKTSIGIPWRVALELISRQWTLRSPIIWQRQSVLPEPTAKDRPWRTYEMLFMFSKSRQYYFNRAGLAGEEDIWKISNRPKNSKGVHSAAFPEELVEKCLQVGCPPLGHVLDPFAGSGTVLRVALRSKRPAVGIDLNERFCEHIARDLSTL